MTGHLIFVKTYFERASWFDSVCSPSKRYDPHGYVLGQLTRMHDGRTLILHLLNYDQVLSENVKVRLDLSGLVPDPSSLELKVLSPDEIRPQLADLSVHRNVIEFTLRRIEHYTVVTFSNGVRP